MMTSLDTLQAFKKLKGWEISARASVGGFEWLAFSKVQPDKMIVISAQKTTIVNCSNGEIKECRIVFDEKELTAICEELPDEMLCIAGQYGGELPMSSGKGERVDVRRAPNHIMRIVLSSGLLTKTLIYDSYDAYICGFSYDGNYFVLADDGGITVLKRG